MLPTIWNYGKTKTPQPNTIAVSVNGVSIFFSYETPIAFWVEVEDGGQVVVRQNQWGRTTGKHIRWAVADFRSWKVVTEEEFEKLWAEQVEGKWTGPTELTK